MSGVVDLTAAQSERLDDAGLNGLYDLTQELKVNAGRGVCGQRLSDEWPVEASCSSSK